MGQERRRNRIVLICFWIYTKRETRQRLSLDDDSWLTKLHVSSPYIYAIRNGEESVWVDIVITFHSHPSNTTYYATIIFRMSFHYNAFFSPLLHAIFNTFSIPRERKVQEFRFSFQINEY